MNFNIVPTPDFEREFKRLAKRHRSLKQDFSELVKSLRTDPVQGVEIAPGIRKIRMAISSKGRGKSGGARVITFNLFADETSGDVYLIDIYDKTDFSTIDVAVVQDRLKDLELM